MKKVFVVSGDGGACKHYRISQPYKNLSDENIYFDILDTKEHPQVKSNVFFNYDAVLIQRPTTPEMVPLIQALKMRGVKVIIETDDLLTHIDPLNTSYNFYFSNGKKNLKIYLDCLKLADAVHVSTPELAEHTKRYNKNVSVFLNSLDLCNEKYHNKLPRLEINGRKVSDRVVCGWFGSHTHRSGIDMIKSAVEQAVSRTNSIFVFSSSPSFFKLFNWDLPNDKIHFLPPTSTVEEYIQRPSLLDINLTPVVLDQFNDSKSELKCLEAAIYGVPSISSPAAPYKRFNSYYNGNILVKKNRTTEWIKEITNLVNNDKRREEIGNLAQKTALENYSLDLINKQRKEWWMEFLYV